MTGQRLSWARERRTNAWTYFGWWFTAYNGASLLLRVVLRSHQEDYFAFWGWLCLVSVTALAYGLFRARRDEAGTVAYRPTRFAWVVVIGFNIGAFVIIWFTDNTSARLVGRGVVSLLLLLLIAMDCLRRSLRR